MEPAHSVTSNVENRGYDDAVVHEMLTSMPLLNGPVIFATDLTMVPPMEMIPTPSPVPDLLSVAWDEVKDGPKGGSVPVDRSIDVLCANKTSLGQQDSDLGFQVTTLRPYRATLRRSHH